MRAKEKEEGLIPVRAEQDCTRKAFHYFSLQSPHFLAEKKTTIYLLTRQIFDWDNMLK